MKELMELQKLHSEAAEILKQIIVVDQQLDSARVILDSDISSKMRAKILVEVTKFLDKYKDLRLNYDKVTNQIKQANYL